MVGIPHGSNRIQGRGASVARDGGLPSDLLNVLTAASDYLKPKKSGGAIEGNRYVCPGGKKN